MGVHTMGKFYFGLGKKISFATRNGTHCQYQLYKKKKTLVHAIQHSKVIKKMLTTSFPEVHNDVSSKTGKDIAFF